MVAATTPSDKRGWQAALFRALLLFNAMKRVAPTNPVPPPHDGEFPTATLSNGETIPLVGLGTASGVRKEHVSSAIAAGYRYLDTAQSYGWGYREDEVGAAVADEGGAGGVAGGVYVQSKIHPEDLGYAATKRAFLVSLDRLGVSSLDSMLLHKPHCWAGACSREPEGTWQESWAALQELFDAGKTRAIGICDVTDSILDELLQQRVKPHIIQNWMDPLHQDKRMRDRCKEEGIQYQAYSSLGTQWKYKGHSQNPVLTNPTLASIAESHGVTVAQVVINWATRHGVSILPASRNPRHQQANLNSFAFDLTENEMRAIDALDGTVGSVRPDPNKVEVIFENQGRSLVRSFWLNGKNEEVPMGTIAPQESLAQQTFHGHKFVFKEGEMVVGEHTVARDGGPRQRHVVVHGEL